MMVSGRSSTTECDLLELAPSLIQASAAVATGRLRLASTQETYALLERGDPEAVTHFRAELVRQIGSTLLWMDSRVIAVYQDPAMRPDRMHAALRIIVHVEFDTAALRNLVDALGEALASANLDGRKPLALTSLEAVIIDDRSMRIADQGYLVLHGNARPLVARD